MLQEALSEHLKNKKDETILVVTDGRPDSERLVKDVIIETTKNLKRHDQLSVSYLCFSLLLFASLCFSFVPLFLWFFSFLSGL